MKTEPVNDFPFLYFLSCSSSDHPLTQFLLQYQYYVYRKLAPLVKDVGFPDVRSGRKATSPQADVVFSESHSDEEAAKTKSEADGEDEEKQGQDTNLQRLPSDSDDEEGGNEANEFREDNAHDDVAQHEVVSGNTGDVCEGSTVDSECVSSVTDLEKLKSLLQEEAQPETPKAEATQVDDSSHGQDPAAVAVADKSENLESYFQELEDDMFGWESEEADKNASDSETGDEEDCREINEKSLSEGKEESDMNVEEKRTEVVEQSTDANDVATSSQLDSLQSEDSHSSDDTHEPSGTDPSCKIGVESEQINEKEELINPTNDGNTLKTDESDSSPREQCTDERGTGDNTRDGEDVQDTKDSETRDLPEEKTFDQTNCDDQGNVQIPKSPLFVGEDGDNRKEEDDNITVPPSDEIRKQLKDVLVDVRFFLGKYIFAIIRAH